MKRTLTTEDKGKNLQCQVTATQDSGSVNTLSAKRKVS
jgi:hypothetical protein